MSNELQKTGPTAIARASFIKENDRTGTEKIGIDDIRLPRLGIAQGLSPQITPGDSKYIENLKMFDLFNDVTGEIYGTSKIPFIPVRYDVHYIEYRPRKDGGGVIDLNVPAGDPRTKWTQGEDGKRVPPRATQYKEWVILMLRGNERPEGIVLSIKTTNKFNRAAADRLNTFIKAKMAPIYAGVYELFTKPEKNDSGTFGVPVVNNVRRLDAEGQNDEEWAKSYALYRHAEMFAATLTGKTIVVEREPGDEDDTDFPPVDNEPNDASSHAGPHPI